MFTKSRIKIFHNNCGGKIEEEKLNRKYMDVIEHKFPKRGYSFMKVYNIPSAIEKTKK